jgi:hypothetical protein
MAATPEAKRDCGQCGIGRRRATAPTHPIRALLRGTTDFVALPPRRQREPAPAYESAMNARAEWGDLRE